MKKIVLTGAQGTGKTTILKKLEYPQITEVVRKLSKLGVNINENGDESGQRKIWNTYEQLFSMVSGWVSDRGLTDVLAYSIWLHRNGKNVSEKFIKKQKKAFEKFLEDNPDIMYCYFPIEFPLVKDGVRSEDENFRKEIDEIIREILEEFVVNYIVISGTVEDRLNIIETIL